MYVHPLTDTPSGLSVGVLILAFIFFLHQLNRTKPTLFDRHYVTTLISGKWFAGIKFSPLKITIRYKQI